MAREVTQGYCKDSACAYDVYTKYFIDEKVIPYLGSGAGEVSRYATKDDLLNKVDKETGKSLISDSEIERLASVTNYNDTEIKKTLKTKANASDIPTKVSQLTNDKGYLTEHQDISNLATKQEVNTKASITDMTNYIEEHKDELKGADGKDGTDGKTPVKGTDYYTEADKQEMVNSIIAALPKYNGGVS